MPRKMGIPCSKPIMLIKLMEFSSWNNYCLEKMKKFLKNALHYFLYYISLIK